MSSSLPEWVYDLEEKMKYSILNEFNTDNRNFSYNEYTTICDGLNISSKKGAENYLNMSNLLEKSKLYFNELKSMKIANRELIIDHKKYLTDLKK